MARFVTVDRKDGPFKVATWEDAGGVPSVVGYAPGLGADHEGLPVWEFRVPTSLETRGRLNEGNHPVGDANGAPLWAGCRVAFRFANHYINTVSGEGTLDRLDKYGGVSVVADREIAVYDRNGCQVARRREQYIAMDDYMRDGPLAGMRLKRGGVGDPHEHGVTPVFVVLADDPRLVCMRLDRDAAPEEEAPPPGPRR